ncbi:DEAD/DEAH box helicase [bacterium endosymbiont of Bathymodiolus sp. 5 South]|jgi:superfamily II DNA or RNA helicase|uniref:DEAD/DEAH box helicase n=1 Tax=bacterium endosymbiont of Bathymodiolus sp. 5 South TaxID=1181670 RepID=UPI0010BA0F8D|nr:SNF2-related protein [bacterium endosymbiont of Bathymodiolus sp. 5 South]CAC9657746.1 DNA/RNA helicases, SNF2 family [uncultured Gammaproteobacteria bacterium]CAC9658950.1 DNA/RNA helicases, SNF2 family [uncultured Gammaproteobacteria bacterium]SHN92746.1 COG0553: Superfamily II DNA/RNA helicases, SNF2 family [bacterium endosymbiont of Bathymodiolus sp. 5 South]VVH56412.1 COG0553: Superfamily II DNA/RNA helicases, SNF2 family [uncultured Gammaproteobacteria bacterium]VVH62258.1 COG0553: Su
MLSLEQIKQAIKDNGAFDRGFQYYRHDALESLEVKHKDSGSIVLNSQVYGNNLYTQTTTILHGRYTIITGKCDCPVGYNCKHVVTAVIAFANMKKPSATSQDENFQSKFKMWADDFQKLIVQEDPVQANNEYMIYRLFGEHGYNSKDIEFVRVKQLKNNELRFYKIDMDKLLYSNTHQHIITKKDQDIITMCRGIFPQYSYYKTNIHGKLGYRILLEMIKTNRCFYQDSEQPLQFTKSQITLELSWKKIENYYKIATNLAQDVHIVASDPVVIIANNQATTLQGISHDTLEKILNAPAVFKSQIIPMYQLLKQDLTEVDIVIPEDFEQKEINAIATPKIKLSNQNKAVVMLNFIYDEAVLNYAPQEQISIILEGDIQYQIQRDLVFENQIKQQFEALGFVSNFSKQQLYFYYENKDRQQYLDFWHQFKQSLGALEQQGFVIEIDPSWTLNFANNAQVAVESETENSWFSLSFNLEFDGLKLPLAPLLSSFITEFDQNETREYVNLEVHADYFVRIKTEQIKPILQVILQLYDGQSQDIKVDAYEAHTLGNIDKNIVWRGSKEVLRLAEKLHNFNQIAPVKVPENLHTTLRDYQKTGLNWLNFLFEFKFSGILADDMGLGKTLQTLTHLSCLKTQKRLKKPVLVVVPTSLIANWKNEVKKFTPNLNLLSLYGGVERFEAFEKIAEADILLTSYALIYRDIDKFTEYHFSYIILDEAQKIKNPKTKMFVAIKSLKSDFRLALSGTPIENHLGELWSIFSFLMPGFLHNQTAFKKKYQTPIEKHLDQDKQKMLNQRIRPFMLRRTKAEVLPELPAKSEIIKYTQFNEKQAALYESIRITMEAKVREAIAQKGLAKSHIMLLDALLKLRQVCCDPQLVKIEMAKKVEESAKLQLFLDLLEELLSENRKILVFSQFTSMLSILQDQLERKNISYTKLTGATKKREEVIEKFTSGQADVFLISLKAGGVGLNLTEADTVIHYDPWWNPAVENQATDRAHRIGQTKAVFVYKLIIENSIEEKILELQKKKLQLQQGIYKGGKTEKISGKELLKLLK